MSKLSVQEIAETKPADFRHVFHWLRARYVTPDFASAQALVNAIGVAAEEMNHHPDLELRWGRVDVKTRSHDVDGITERDIRLATTISELAAKAGATSEPSGMQQIEIGLDTWAGAEVKPFWDAILGFALPNSGADPDPDEVVDPMGQSPTVWFQDTDEHETPRQRFHLDIWVAAEEAEARVQAAIAAGGTLTDDSEAPAFWVIADSQGNRACVCTVLERG